MQVDTGGPEPRTFELFDGYVTNNLKDMAKAANIYLHIWRPAEKNVTTAADLIEPFTRGLHQLKSQPKYFKEFNPPNGWGTYEGFVKFVEDYLTSCRENPKALVSANG